MESTIYALIDPDSHVVRYVGQTTNIKNRYQTHCSGKDLSTGAWVKSLSQPPHLLILETANDNYVSRKDRTIWQSTTYLRASTIAETKWIKRFRRTVLNKRLRENSRTTWDRLVNKDEASPPL
jgi:hypothetical protein